jgi:uncharacterized protein YndB with AHSA1/START domain
MKEPSVIHSTFVIERSYPVSPQRIFSAFANPSIKRRWFAEGLNHEVENFEMDFVVGGAERSRYRLKEGTPFPGVELASEGIYQDIVPNERVVVAQAMTFGEKRISAALVTVELLPSEAGTNLVFTHQAAFFPGADGPQMREAGWTSLFERLETELARAPENARA